MINISVKQISKNFVKSIVGEMHIGKRIRKMHLLNVIERLNPYQKVILDAGCGTGDHVYTFAQKYPHSIIKGIELNRRTYEICKRRNSMLRLSNISFTNQDLCNSLGNTEYDLIYSVDVLEHIEEDKKVLKNMCLALRSGGHMLLHVPLVEKHIFKKIRGMPKQSDHVRDGYEEKDLLKKIVDNGFTIIEKRYTFARYRGAFAWEIWKLFSQNNFIIQLAFHPFTILLSWMDGIIANKNGGGILLLAKKCTDN